jgi:transcriptional regulator with XRE-family HTH domain
MRVTMTMTTHYSTKTKELRVKRAWSQEQLADIAGVNVRTIQRIEHGDGASFESLKAVANAFGVDVGELLAPPTAASQPADKKDGQQPQRVTFLGRVRTGRQLFNVVGGAEMYSYDHDDADGDDVELIARFFQDIRDYADLWSDIEPGDRIRIPYEFNARIVELEERGHWVFAGSQRRAYSFGWAEKPEIMKLNTAVVIILKKDNPVITRLGDEDAALAVAQG